MKRNHRFAFNALEKIGAPVFENGDTIPNGNFKISGEDNIDEIWADYWCMMQLPEFDFGVNPKITKILDKYGLYAEWENAGCLSVWEK